MRYEKGDRVIFRDATGKEYTGTYKGPAATSHVGGKPVERAWVAFDATGRRGPVEADRLRKAGAR